MAFLHANFTAAQALVSLVVLIPGGIALFILCCMHTYLAASGATTWSWFRHMRSAKASWLPENEHDRLAAGETAPLL